MPESMFLQESREVGFDTCPCGSLAKADAQGMQMPRHHQLWAKQLCSLRELVLRENLREAQEVKRLTNSGLSSESGLGGAVQQHIPSRGPAAEHPQPTDVEQTWQAWVNE